MTDLEITELCALAMGWEHLGAVGVAPPAPDAPDQSGLWCLSGGNDWWIDPEGFNVCSQCVGIPDPLHDDAQAMAMVKKLRLQIEAIEVEAWTVGRMEEAIKHGYENVNWTCGTDLNRAICECVAEIRKWPS